MSESSKPTKTCFVVSQIGDEESAERISADWFFEAIVQPVFAEKFSEYEVRRADNISDPGMIDAQIISKLISVDLVIADLTNTNPNVFYEIGLRHMAQKPIIHMHQKGSKIPFDVSLYRSIGYSRMKPRDLESARSELTRAIDSVHAPGYEVENPVSRALGKIKFDQKASPQDKFICRNLLQLKIVSTTLRISSQRLIKPLFQITTSHNLQ